MKKIYFFIIILLAVPAVASAQMGMMPARQSLGAGGGGYYGQGESVNSPAAQSSEIQSALQNIYQAQNISDQQQIDCAKVTDQQFAVLGDAYMGLMVPNSEQHTAMDSIMGGEGSQSLQLAHINMGRSYLGCWSDYNGNPTFMPMMGYGYYGASSTPWGMMGYYQNSSSTAGIRAPGNFRGIGMYPYNSQNEYYGYTCSPFMNGRSRYFSGGWLSGFVFIGMALFFIVWILVIVVLILAIRRLWQKSKKS